jgi:hypothetical protein
MPIDHKKLIRLTLAKKPIHAAIRELHGYFFLWGSVRPFPAFEGYKAVT